MTAWVPKRGDRVIAVLPDGHEIEGWLRSDGMWASRMFMVGIAESPHESVVVRTVKPVTPPEPTTLGARVVDANGKNCVRCERAHPLDSRFCWYTLGKGWRRWSELPQPVRIIEADPSWDAS